MGILYTAGFDIVAATPTAYPFLVYFTSSGKTTFYIKAAGSGGSHYYYLHDYDANASQKYSHLDIHDMTMHDGSTTPLSSTWADDSLAGLLQETINAAATAESWGGTFTVSFSVATGKYTVSHSSLTFSMVMDYGTEDILGFTNQSQSGASSYTSNNVSKFCLLSEHDGMSMVTDEYEPMSISSLAVSDSARAFGMSRTIPMIYMDWNQQFETHARTHLRKATTSNPWTFQHLFEHCRTVYPFVACTEDFYSSYYPVCILREDGASFRPQRAIPDFDDYWHIQFKTYLYGWVGA